MDSNKKLSAYLILSAFTFISACGIIEPDCGGPELFKLMNVLYEAQEVDQQILSSGEVFIDVQEELSEGDSIQYDRYNIQMLFELDFVLSSPRPSPLSQLIPKAYACTPAQVIEDRIDSIKVYSLMDYSPQFLAGSDCTELFQFACVENDENCDSQILNLSQLNNSGIEIPENLNIFLSTAPVQDGSYAFRVECYIDGVDVELSVYETEEVYIFN